MEKNPNIPISAHVNQSLSSVPPQISSQIPTTEVISRQLRYYHGNVRPPLPKSALELELPDADTKTTHNETFLVHDELLEGARLLVFVSEFIAYFLCSSLIVSCDGTFQTVPKIFFQLFTLNFFYHNKLLPGVYALASEKSTRVYSRIFHVVKEFALKKGLKFSPPTIISDFEHSLLTSIHAHFPDSQNQGCFFHFTQCIYRKIKQTGLSSLYLNNDNFRLFIRLIMALAFLPDDEVLASFLIFEQFVQNKAKFLIPFCEYFRRTWLVNIPLWNVHGKSIRTNNDHEGWHAKVARCFSCPHPNIYRFLTWMREEENETRHVISLADSGRVVKRPNKRAVQCNNRIDKLTSEYLKQTRTRSSFLKGCALNLAEMSIPKHMEIGDSDISDSFPEFPLQTLDSAQRDSSPRPNVLQPLDETTFPFSLPDSAWQLEMCTFLNLPFIAFILPFQRLRSAISLYAQPLSRIEILGDGNCFFRTISYFLTGSQDAHFRIRNLLCDFIERNYILLALRHSYLQDSNMRTPSIWATESEILACASLLNASIFVFTATGTVSGRERWVPYLPNQALSQFNSTCDSPSLYIHHQNQNHYVPVIAV